ncbi:trypsin-like serine protease [Sorangium sp. So ce388]|uniref:trypsin-like serine protease n=1 Tax=Sorangium sp. So ce388 TaxID=3133309 RepID=UPI003F5AEF3D
MLFESKDLVSGLLRFGGVCCSAVLLTACAINGVQDDHTAVVKIESSTGLCSGTYLGSGLVVTAAHCVTGATWMTVSFVDYNNSANDKTIAVSDTITFQDYAGDPAQDETNDLAALFIDSCFVPSAVPAMRVLDSDAGPLNAGDIGTALTEVGFGSTSPPSSTAPYGSGSGDRFSGPTTLEKLDAFYANVTSDASQTQACYGDSGSPLIVRRGGIEYIAGVLSKGDTDCDGTDYYTRLDNNRNADFLGAASAAALLSLHSCSPGTGGGCSVSQVESPGGAWPFAVVVAPIAIAALARRARRRGGA